MEYATRCEMKNINTFSGAMRAIEYESHRQMSLLEDEQSVSQQTAQDLRLLSFALQRVQTFGITSLAATTQQSL
jgi:aspartyl-tRNA(Asn)/glutamyl-tRNA(Gln) amidotransferase subunit B